jgi:hypothetical protein
MQQIAELVGSRAGARVGAGLQVRFLAGLMGFEVVAPAVQHSQAHLLLREEWFTQAIRLQLLQCCDPQQMHTCGDCRHTFMSA